MTIISWIFLLQPEKHCSLWRRLIKTILEITSSFRKNAVMRPLEILAEASSKISKEFRKAQSEIPRRERIGLRNRLIHEYFRIDYGTVWDILHKDIPKLIEAIEPLMPKEDEI